MSSELTFLLDCGLTWANVMDSIKHWEHFFDTSQLNMYAFTESSIEDIQVVDVLVWVRLGLSKNNACLAIPRGMGCLCNYAGSQLILHF